MNNNDNFIDDILQDIDFEKKNHFDGAGATAILEELGINQNITSAPPTPPMAQPTNNVVEKTITPAAPVTNTQPTSNTFKDASYEDILNKKQQVKQQLSNTQMPAFENNTNNISKPKKELSDMLSANLFNQYTPAPTADKKSKDNSATAQKQDNTPNETLQNVNAKQDNTDSLSSFDPYTEAKDVETKPEKDLSNTEVIEDILQKNKTTVEEQNQAKQQSPVYHDDTQVIYVDDTQLSIPDVNAPQTNGNQPLPPKIDLTNKNTNDPDDIDINAVINAVADKDNLQSSSTLDQNTLSQFNIQHGVQKDDFRKFFTTTVAIDEETIKARKPKFAFGQKILEKAQTTPDDESIELEDIDFNDFAEGSTTYHNHDDAVDVLATLRGKRFSSIVKLLLTTALFITSLVLTFSASFSSLQDIAILSDPVIYLILQFAILLLATIINIKAVANGILALFGKPNTDIFVTTTTLASVIQIIVLLIFNQDFAQTPSMVVSTISILIMMFNIFGRYMLINVTIKNFELSCNRVDSSAAHVLENLDNAKKITDGMGEENPQILVSRPTGLITNLVNNSFSTSQSDMNAKKVSLISLISAVVSSLLCYLLMQSPVAAITTFAVAFCISSPLTHTLTHSLPSMLMRGAACRVGAVITGPSSVEKLSCVNTVMANSRDIFPLGTVNIAGIKTFEKERIDLAILYAASLLIDGCDTLRDIFLSVIEGNTNMLFPVENFTKEIGYGFTGWIDNNRIIVGNRAMIYKHGIELPSLDYENRFTKGTRQPVYLAVSGKLFAMFLIKYQTNNEVGSILADLQEFGIGLLVSSDDFNITSDLIEEKYMLAKNSVKVLTNTDSEILAPSLSYMPTTDAVISHMGTFSSYLGGLYAAISAKSAEHQALIIQFIGLLMGLVIIFVLTFTQGIFALNVTAIILFQLAWLVLGVAVALLKKY